MTDPNSDWLGWGLFLAGTWIGFTAALYLRDFLTWLRRRRVAILTSNTYQSDKPENPKSETEPDLTLSTHCNEYTVVNQSLRELK